MAKKYISWRRVSTFKQNKSGLGLEAQKDIIRFFIERDKGEWIADYEECYTGTELSGCVELHKAMQHAKRENAILIIAKSDRFRNTAEALKIYEQMGDGNIMFCDLPTSDKFSLTLFFALAEREALLVSIRTRQALAAKKKRGEATGGASPKWRETFNKQTREQKDEYLKRRGCTINDKSLQKKEVQVFLRIVKKAFEFDNDDATSWDWTQVNTRGENKNRLLDMMKDFRDLDDNGVLFHTWNFNDNKTKLQIKLATLIKNTRRMVFYRQKNNY